MFISNQFEYKTLERQTSEDGTRFYLTPETGEPLPSVTTILGHTSDKTFLIEWAKRVGQAEADRIRNEAAALGTLLHTHMECHIQGIERPSGNNLIRQMARTMSDVIIEKGIPNVSEVWGFEVPLYFPGLYAGTTDLVGIHKGEPAIMDYKNTKKMKKKEKITDYFCQCCAYALAHNYLYDTSIKKVVIFMVARDHQYEEFVIEGDEFERYCEIWQQRLVTYDMTGGPKALKVGQSVEIHSAVANIG